jgi:AAA15 family ATPase/GTPase
MLIEFSVGNYLSFKEKVTFSMVASQIKSGDAKVDENNIFPVDGELSLLKSAAVYGANASGKSNLVKAMNFMRFFVLSSSKETQITDEIDVRPFKLSTETIGEPSHFEIVFICNKKIYRYGFEVDHQQIISEWLFHVPKKRESYLFKRTKNDIKTTKVFSEGEGLEKRTRKNALFISVVAQFNGTISSKILSFFGENLNVISGLETEFYREIAVDYFDEYGSDIIKIIKKLDLGIDRIQISTKAVLEDELPRGIPEQLRKIILMNKLESSDIQTFHKKYDSEGAVVGNETFSLDRDESHGTQKLFAFAGPILETLKRGEILVIDELDARLHPLITKTIIELFNSNETNPHNAQLIFMTHDTNLLTNTIFRRDQIWFTEKDRQGATDLYSLVEYNIKNEDSFESDYIKGRYGAIPFIGNLRKVIVEIDG